VIEVVVVLVPVPVRVGVGVRTGMWGKRGGLAVVRRETLTRLVGVRVTVRISDNRRDANNLFMLKGCRIYDM
jgi:hypothetical protein